MEEKKIKMTIDSENGIKHILLSKNEIKKTKSISDDGVGFLNELGADIVLDFDKDNNLVSIELMGF